MCSRSLVFLMLILSCFSLARTISINDYELWYREGLVNSIWCSVSVKDEDFVRGKRL